MEKPNVTGLEEAAGIPIDVAAGEQPIEITSPPGTGEAPDTRGVPEPIDAEDTAKADAPPEMEKPGSAPEAESRKESGGFLRNIVDRVKLWREKARVGKQEGEVKKLTAKKEAEEKKATEAKKAEEKLKEEINKAEELLKKQGREPAEAKLGNAVKEIEIFQKKAEAALERAKEYEGKIEGAKEKVEKYKEKVEEATGKIEGRLLAKQEKNNEAIDKLKIQREGLDDSVKMYDGEIDKLKGQKKEIEELLKEKPHKKVAEALQKELLDIQKAIQSVEKLKNKFVEKRDLAASKVRALEGDNKNLQSKREELRPELKQKKADEAAPAAAAEAAPTEAAAPATAETAPVATPETPVEAPTTTSPGAPEASSPSEGEVERGQEAGDTRAIELKILDLEEEKERLESMDLTEMAAKTAELTPAQKKAVKKMMKTGKYEMPKGTDASEAAGAELNRIFQRIPQINKELSDLRRQLKRAQLGGGEAAPRTRGRKPKAAPAPEVVSPAPTEAPEDLPVVDEPVVEAPAVQVPSTPEAVSAAPEKSSEEIKAKFFEEIEREFGDKKNQERVDAARGWFYDDVFEKEELPTIQGHIDSVQKMSKEEFADKFKTEGADANVLSDADFEEIREAMIKKLKQWKELAEKKLKEDPRPRPEKKVSPPAELEKPTSAEKSSEDIKKDILKNIGERFSDEILQTNADWNIQVIQGNIDAYGKMNKETFLGQFAKGVAVENFSDKDFEEARAALIERGLRWKELAEKALKEKPAEGAPTEPVAEPPAEEGVDLEAIEALGKDIEESEKK